MFEERIAAMNQRTEESIVASIREHIPLMRFRTSWVSAEQAHITS